MHTSSVSFFVKEGGGNQSQLNSFCSSHIPLKYVYIHIHCIHTYILKTLSPFITKFHFPYTSILFIYPYHITKPFTIYHKKKEEKLQPLNISQKKKQSPSPKPFTHREEQFQPLECFTPKKKGCDGITTEEDGKLIYKNNGKHNLLLTSR